MISMPVVSVIIPVYRAEKTLRRCVESVFAQTHRQLSLYLSDDGSIDESASMCDCYATLNTRTIVIHNRNHGVSAARNAGLALHDGDFVAFIDSDDYADSAYIGDMVQPQNQADITVGCVRYRTATSLLKYTEQQGQCLTISTRQELRDAFPQILNARKLNYVYAKLYRAAVLHSVRFQLDVCLGEDTLFVFDAIQNAKTIQFIDSCGYNYIKYQTNTLTTQRDGETFSRYITLNERLQAKIGQLGLQSPAISAALLQRWLDSAQWAASSIYHSCLPRKTKIRRLAAIASNENVQNALASSKQAGKDTLLSVLQYGGGRGVYAFFKKTQRREQWQRVLNRIAAKVPQTTRTMIKKWIKKR